MFKIAQCVVFSNAIKNISKTRWGWNKYEWSLHGWMYWIQSACSIFIWFPRHHFRFEDFMDEDAINEELKLGWGGLFYFSTIYVENMTNFQFYFE